MQEMVDVYRAILLNNPLFICFITIESIVLLYLAGVLVRDSLFSCYLPKKLTLDTDTKNKTNREKTVKTHNDSILTQKKELWSKETLADNAMLVVALLLLCFGSFGFFAGVFAFFLYKIFT